MTKKHVFAAAAGALMLGTTALSAAPMQSNGTLEQGASSGATKVHDRTHRTMRHHASRSREGVRAADMNQAYQGQWDNRTYQGQWGPFGLPFAAAQGAAELGTAAVGAGLGTAGAVVGGTVGALTGYPYGYGAYGSYGYVPGDSYASYGYAPGAYGYAPGSSGSVGLGRDIGHSYYNGFGSPAPASQDNCAVDGGYGRKDYSVAC